MKSSTKVLIVIGAVLGIFLIIGLVLYFTSGVQVKSYTDFRADLETEQIQTLNIESDTAYVRLVTHRGNSGYDYKVNIRYENDLELQAAIKNQIDMRNNDSDDANDIVVLFNDRYATDPTSYIFPILGLILLIVLAVFLMRTMKTSNTSAMNFGKNAATLQTQTKVRFSDVAGAEEEKEELVEVVEFLKNPHKFTMVGARIPRGVLLVGPPGTGKTLFAKAVAGEANVPFFSISGSDFVEMFVGVGASRVRDLFDQAKKNMPCIIFIDEIDAVGRQRGAGLGGGNDEREQTLNQLLVQMDGFETNDGIIVMAATNRSDILDPALLRPGRFDRQIYVHVPDVRGREAIFKVHARNKPMAGDVDFQVLARITSGFSGAEIENLLNEAAILCARDNRTKITMEDLYEGIDKVVMGPQKKSRLVTEIDKRITAYHESGHAIVAKCIKECDPVHEISIIPRGQAAGYTMTRPDSDDDHMTISKLRGLLAMTMGGRSAEELVIEDITTGAVGDIKQATSIARKMVTEWGMSSKIGPIYYGGSQEVFLGRDYGSQHTYSESVASDIDGEVLRLVDTAHKTALDILKSHRDVMDAMVRVLIECETIYSEEVDMLMNGATVEEVKASLNNREKNKSVHRNDMEKGDAFNMSDKQGQANFNASAPKALTESEPTAPKTEEIKPTQSEADDSAAKPRAEKPQKKKPVKKDDDERE